MLKKRLIFTLLYDNGSFVLSRNFRLQRVGNLAWLQKNYKFSKIAFSIDELVVLDVSRGTRDVERFSNHLKEMTDGCFVPIAAGGGVRTLEQARTLLRSGADKVVVNSPLHDDPTLVEELASEFGQQCVVAAVDFKRSPEGEYQAWIENGCRPVQMGFSKWMEYVVNQPVGEVYLNSIDRDGTGQGYDLRVLEYLPVPLSKPLIMAGGVGHSDHLSAGLTDSRIDAVATAHLFNFVGDGLVKARMSLLNEGQTLAQWNQLSPQSLDYGRGEQVIP